MTVFEALKNSRSRLAAEGIESASLDASLILSHLTNLSKVQLITHDTDELSDEILDKLNVLIEKRINGYPVAYILGYKEFWGLKLKVTEDTLIPRPDTEILVQKAIDCRVHGPILDMGTGTGAIILALKSEYKNAIEAYACDISKKALDVARENAKALSLAVTFIESDWFKSLGDRKFSLIVSNPPYIEDDDPHLSKTSLPFEPICALTSGADGLDDIRIICREALSHLETGAPLLVEHGYNQGRAVAEIFTENGYKNVETIKDFAGNDRVTIGYNL
ncbi:MAG: peptide chain release factor N(5)-glutamine methyltransferase [Succinivibrio dextrinosolvens]|nr:peptide chain release factor N(5)-glutamine methyltransferase [Succinivibrio dextrinosolvens]MDY6421059.1 peptide chain release factor N(5)-glutamine methyltransferase [Succinivibrio dextrinosolvens]MDY6466468.1 peptide chain release factor N(5)-glutamine methyltransferase [Succinivibrio dextrinosolvens]MDY6470211.1 peptide chain release factor N(5)-glutamine methyltransferase [Succinivibrio dextrinosolvens]